MRLLTNLKTLFVVTAAVAGIASRLEAGPIVTVPTGLAPGSQYRLAFITAFTYGSVTNGTYQATSSSIATYNNDVANEAAQITELNGLGATWSAIASTDAVSASANIGASPASVGIYLLDGTTLVANGTGTTGSGLFSGTLLARLNYTDIGTSIITTNQSNWVWTGSHTDGTSYLGRAMGDSPVQVGLPGYANTVAWLDDVGYAPPDSLPLYAISSVLTVQGASEPTPEPATTALAALGLASLFAALRLRKQRNVLANPTDR